MIDTVSETEVIFEVWQNGDMVAAADSLADAEHFMLVYGQDGPVEAKTAITTRFPGFNVVTAMLAASPQGEDRWIKHDGGPNPVPRKMVEVRYRNGKTEKQTSERAAWGHWKTKMPYLGAFDIIAYRVIEGVKP